MLTFHCNKKKKKINVKKKFFFFECRILLNEINLAYRSRISFSRYVLKIIERDTWFWGLQINTFDSVCVKGKKKEISPPSPQISIQSF